MELLQQPNNTAETIRAISSTWPLVLIFVVLLFVLIYKKNISRFLSKFNKISGKTSVAEIKLEVSDNKEDAVLNTQDNVLVIDNPNVAIEENKELTQAKEELSLANVWAKLIEGKTSDAENLFKAVNEKEHDSIQKFENELLFLRFKYLFPKIDTTEEIKNKISNAPNNELKSRGLDYIGDIYSDLKNYTYAIQYYESSLELTTQEQDIAYRATKIAQTYYLNNQKEKCLPFLYSIKAKLNEPKSLSKIYVAIATYFEKENDKINRLLALEAATSLDPSDTSTLFTTAYEYAQPNTDMNVLSFVHYEEYLSFKPNDPSVLNNLAVSYNRLDMLGKAVTYFKRSSELDNTLASSNLANKYIATGFFDEAKQLLNTAKSGAEVHENVWASLKDLADKEHKENEKLKEVRDRGGKLQLFLRKFSEKYFSDSNINLIELNGSWYQNSGLAITLTKMNTAYYEIKWQADGYNYKVTVPFANYQNVTGEGEKLPVGGGIINKLNVFAMSNYDRTTLSILVYDKRDDFGSIYEFQKITLSSS